MQQKLAVLVATAVLVVACAAPQPPQPEEQHAQVTPPPPRIEQAQDQARVAISEARTHDLEKKEMAAGVVDGAAANRSAAKAMIAPSGMPAPSAPMLESFARADVLGGSRYAPMEQDRETYAHLEDGSVIRVAENPVSTFSIDVDTGSYSNLRRFLRDGALPRQDAVRVEEMINYFDYGYAPPKDRRTPFAVYTQLAPTPWNAKTQLLRVGLKGWQPEGALPPSNLVFLVDVSGSMSSADKLPLVKSSLKLLVNELSSRDTLSLAVYAGSSGVVLPPTHCNEKAKILAALEHLEAGGSTNGGEGIRLAYSLAEQGYLKGGINRVLIATDGDFNVGTVDFEQLKDLVEEKRKSGVALSTLGFGTGNYNDQLMEQLADAGNGNYTYVDGLQEARRALVQSRAATLQTIAKDVKIQVEFNPAVVSEYRLIGYENRALKREDFNNDAVDAGEIGAGHSVTALYEVTLKGSGGEHVDPLHFGGGGTVGWAEQRSVGWAERRSVGWAERSEAQQEIAWLKLRYKAPEGDTSKLIERAITRADAVGEMTAASESLRFAAAVSAFGQVLRGGRYTGHYGYDDVLKLARSARGDDAQGWKGEFVQLVELAQSLSMHAANGHTESAD